MKLTNRVTRTLAIGALTLTLGASLAAAQDVLTPTAEPNFGSVPLSTPFRLDPFVVSMLSGGDIDASTLNLDDSCRGFVSPAPDFRVTLESPAASLRILFAGEGDTTLVVSGPNNITTCNDDGSGLDPLVDLINPVAGDYNIWVGSYSEGEFVPGYLMISEQAAGAGPMQSDILASAVGANAVDPQIPVSTSLDPDIEATFGEMALAPGFTPDPFTVDILSGGEVNVSLLSLGAGCIGYAAAEPDFSLNLSGAFPQMTIGFTSGDDIDTTLIVRDAAGQYTCNDDFNGTDPQITLNNVAAGQVDVWVGTYSDDYSDGVLSVSAGGAAPIAPTAAPNNNGQTPVTGATTVPPVAIPSATPQAGGTSK